MMVFDPYANHARPLSAFVQHGAVGDYMVLESITGRRFALDRTGRSVEAAEGLDEALVDPGFLVEAMPPFLLSTLPDDVVAMPPILEGADDPDILKAIFVVGAGGSGKSKIAADMFPGSGLKVINQDKHLEKILAAAKIPLKDVGMHYTLQKKAQRLKNAEVRQYGLRRLGLLIDSTGWDYPRIAEPAKSLRKLGYDLYMVFITTSLDTALDRNKKRADAGDRDVPTSFIKTAHAGSHANLTKFQALFGGKNVFVIDNDTAFGATTWSTIVAPALRKLGDRILRAPVKNPIGKAWLERHKTTSVDAIPVSDKQKFPREKPPTKFKVSTYIPMRPPDLDGEEF